MPTQQKKVFPFNIGADPEFNILLHDKKVDAQALITKIMSKSNNKKDDYGYKVNEAGYLGWDGYHSTAEIRPKHSKDPKKLVDNIGELFKELTDKTKLFDLSTLSDKGSVGGHLHFEVTPEIAEDKTRKTTIHKIMSTFYIPLMMGENKLNLKIRMKSSYGNISDYRVESKGPAYTYEFRVPSAEWLTTPKVAYATICYLGVIFNEALSHTSKIKKNCGDILYANHGQGEALQLIALSGLGAISDTYVNKIRKYIKTFELYPQFKEEIEYILKPSRVLLEKEKVQYNIGRGWKMDQTKQPSKQLLLSTKKLKEEAKKINMEDMLSIIKIDFNPDLNVELMVNEIKQRVIALGWKLEHNYVFFGIRQGIKHFISRNSRLGFLSGKEAMKSKDDHSMLYDLFDKVEAKFNSKQRYEAGNRAIIDKGRTVIGIPYEDRINKDPKRLVELIYNIEKGLMTPIPESFYNSLERAKVKNSKDIEEKETFEILSEKTSQEIMEDPNRSAEAQRRLNDAMIEQNGQCQTCGEILNENEECTNPGCSNGQRNLARMRREEHREEARTIIVDEDINIISASTTTGFTYATTGSIISDMNTPRYTARYTPEGLQMIDTENRT